MALRSESYVDVMSARMPGIDILRQHVADPLQGMCACLVTIHIFTGALCC